MLMLVRISSLLLAILILRHDLQELLNQLTLLVMMLKLSSLTLQKINLHTVKEMPVWKDNRDTEPKENQ